MSSKTSSLKETSNVKTDNEKERSETNMKSETKNISKVESDVEDKNNDEDPFKDEKRLKMLKKIISHLCLLVLILSIRNLIIGLVAAYFYEDKTHLVVYGWLCVIQLIGAQIGWCAIRIGNRFLFLCCFIINIIWIVIVICFLLYYWIFNRTDSFNNEISLHVGAVFFLSASLVLGICCFCMMQKIEMINFQYKKRETNKKSKE